MPYYIDPYAELPGDSEYARAYDRASDELALSPAGQTIDALVDAMQAFAAAAAKNPRLDVQAVVDWVAGDDMGALLDTLVEDGSDAREELIERQYERLAAPLRALLPPVEKPAPVAKPAPEREARLEAALKQIDAALGDANRTNRIIEAVLGGGRQ